jgi:hypothetical protein
MFMTRKDQFIGSKGNTKRLKEGILRDYSVNNTYSFICAIKCQPLNLMAVIHPGKHTSIEATLEETVGRVDNGPVLY